MEIRPTMTDADVMAFVADGYVLLEGVVAGDIPHYAATPGKPLSQLPETSQFLEQVVLHPLVAGVARSLLGLDFLVPTNTVHHVYDEPHPGQTWHTDGLTETGAGVSHLQCFYYPQPVEIADGPTIILPGSSHRLVDREAIAHYGDLLGQVALTVPAGSVVLTHYGLWHRAGPKLNNGRREMIKFSYFRTALPRRDWLTASDEHVPEFVDPDRRPSYLTQVDIYRERIRCRRTWEWLCGIESQRDQGYWGTDGMLATDARPVSDAPKDSTFGG